MTLNMIYIILYLLIIHIIIAIKTFLLTRQRLKTALFSHFSSSCENHFRFRRCTEPTPKDPRSEGIRIAIDANQCLSFLLIWIKPGSDLISF